MKSFRVLLLAIILVEVVGACSQKGSGPQGVAGETQPTTIQLPQTQGSTNVGSGGNGAEAQWKSIAQALLFDIRRLNVSGIDLNTFRKIKNEFPKTVAKATVEFKDYPLILSVETAEKDNPSGAEFKNALDCSKLAKKTDSSRERDAINFVLNQKIKVSRPRFSCIQGASEEARRLVLHEYLGLLGITEDADGKTDYHITNRLLSDFKSIQAFDEGLETVMVRNCKELQAVGTDDMEAADYLPLKLWKLANDIDCGESRHWNAGSGFEPRILNGNLDGDGYSIRNIYIKAVVPFDFQAKREKMRVKVKNMGVYPNIDFMNNALFFTDCRKCVIGNLNIENATVYGNAILISVNPGDIRNVFYEGKLIGTVDSNFVGGLTAVNQGTASYISGQVHISRTTPVSMGIDVRAGGITGYNQLGNIHHGTYQGTIEGYSDIGGLAGENAQGFVSNSSTDAQIIASSCYQIGGIVGINGGLVKSVLARGTISFSSRCEETAAVGGIVGVNIKFKENLEQVPVGELPMPVTTQLADGISKVTIDVSKLSSYYSDKTKMQKVLISDQIGYDTQGDPKVP